MTATHITLPRNSESLSIPLLDLDRSPQTFEKEILTKFDFAIHTLKTLLNFATTARQDLLAKFSSDSGNNERIITIKGRVIRDKTKFYHSVDSELQSFSSRFQSEITKLLGHVTTLAGSSGADRPEAGKTPKASSTFLSLASLDINREELGQTSPFVKTVTLPSNKLVESQKKCSPLGIVRPMSQTTIRVSSLTDLGTPRASDVNTLLSIPNPFGGMKSNNSPVFDNTLKIPENEEEDAEDVAISKIKLNFPGIEDENEDLARSGQRPIRSRKSHGFRLSQGKAVTEEINFNLEPADA